MLLAAAIGNIRGFVDADQGSYPTARHTGEKERGRRGRWLFCSEWSQPFRFSFWESLGGTRRSGTWAVLLPPFSPVRSKVQPHLFLLLPGTLIVGWTSLLPMLLPLPSDLALLDCSLELHQKTQFSRHEPSAEVIGHAVPQGVVSYSPR